MKNYLCVAVSLLFLNVSAGAFNYHFSSAEIVDTMEFTFGYFNIPAGYSLPMRVDFPVSDDLHAFGQCELLQEDVTTESLHTIALGGGAVYQFYPQTNEFPVNLAIKFGYLHIIEKTRNYEFVRYRIVESNIISISGIASKNIEEYIDYDVVTYAVLSLSVDISDSNSYSTFSLGARAHFTDQWSAYLQIDFGRIDGFGIGGAYRF
jgi:hypothetical protein